MHQENALVEYQQRGNATSRQQTQRPEKKTTTSLEKTLTLADDDMNTQGTTLPAKPPKPPSLSEIEEVPLESTEKETPQHLISSKDKAYLGAENASTSALSSRASSPLAVQSSAAPDPSLQPSTSLSSVLDGATNTEGDRPMPPPESLRKVNLMFSDHTKALLRSLGSGSLGSHPQPPWHRALTGNGNGEGDGSRESALGLSYVEETGPPDATSFQRTLPLVAPKGSGFMSAGAPIRLEQAPGARTHQRT